MQAKTYTVVDPIDHHTVPAPKLMQFAAAPITVRQKSDKNNPLGDEICSYGVEGTCCVIMCSEFCSFLAYLCKHSNLRGPIHTGVLLVAKRNPVSEF